jgi:hypothetical protein
MNAKAAMPNSAVRAMISAYSQKISEKPHPPRYERVRLFGYGKETSLACFSGSQALCLHRRDTDHG